VLAEAGFVVEDCVEDVGGFSDAGWNASGAVSGQRSEIQVYLGMPLPVNHLLFWLALGDLTATESVDRRLRTMCRCPSPITADASRTFSVVELRRSGRRVIARDDCLASPLVEATDQRVHFVGNRAGFDDSNRRTKRQSDHRHDEPIELVGAESNRARIGFGVDGRVVDP